MLSIRISLDQEVKHTIELKQLTNIVRTDAGNDARLQYEVLQKLRKDLEQGKFVDPDDFFGCVIKRVPKQKRSPGVKQMIEEIQTAVPRLELDLIGVSDLIDFGLGAFHMATQPLMQYRDLNSILKAKPGVSQEVFDGLLKNSQQYHITNLSSVLRDTAKDGRFENKETFLSLLAAIQKYADQDPQALDWVCRDFISMVPQDIKCPIVHKWIIETGIEFHQWGTHLIPKGEAVKIINSFFTRSKAELQVLFSHYSALPKSYLVFLPFQVVENQAAMQKLNSLCQEKYFQKNRDVKRSFLLLSGLETLDKKQAPLILHLVKTAKTPRQLKKAVDLLFRKMMLGGIDSYPFQAETYAELMQKLEEKEWADTFKQLPLSKEYQDKFMQATHLNPQILKIILRLSSIYAGKHPEELPVLVKMTQELLDENFIKWRYGNEKALKQLEIIGGRSEAWQEDAYEVKIIASQDKLEQLEGMIKHLNSLGERAKNIFKEQFGAEASEALKSRISGSLMTYSEKFKAPNLSKEEKKRLGQEKRRLTNQYHFLNLIELFYPASEQIDFSLKILKDRRNDKRYQAIHDLINEAVSLLSIGDLASLHSVFLVETDNCLDLFEVGRIPVLTCQRWTEATTQNECLPAYAADANKKLLKIEDRITSEVLCRAILRLLPYRGKYPLLLLEGPYSRVWTQDYARLFIGRVVQKAVRLAKEQGGYVYIGYAPSEKNEFYDQEFKKIAQLGQAKIYRNKVSFNLPPSINPWEYSDTLGGKMKSGSKIEKVDLRLLVVGEED